MRIKRSGKLIAVLVAMSVILSSAPLLVFAQAPADSKGHWAQETIERWVDRKIVQGYPDGTFKPDAPITRAEFVALINRTFGFTTLAPLELSDLSDDVWFTEDVSKALGAGYVEGYPDGTFKPNANISRQEAAVVLARILGLQVTGNVLPFEDSQSIPDWSKGAIAAVAKAGIMKGHTDGSFDPAGNFTRAETVTVLDRIFAEVFDESGQYGDDNEQTIIDGNAVVLSGGTNLSNIHVKGDLLIAQSVGEGTVILDKVIVDGKLTVKGGGANSVYLRQCMILTVSLDKDGARLVLQDGTEIIEIYVNAPSIVEQDPEGKSILITTLNITIGGVTLVNVHITGDLVIGDSVEEGQFTLENVVIEGDIVSESGEIIEDSQPPLAPLGGDEPSTVRVRAISVEVVDGEAEITDDGGTLQLRANVTPTNASNKGVIWSVDDERIATIDQTGLLTAAADGDVTVTATAKDGSGKKGELVVEISEQSAVIVTSDGELATALADGTKTTIILDGDEFNGFTITRGMKIVGGTIKVESADNIPGAIPKGIYIKTNDQVEIVGVEFVDGDSGHAQRKGIVTESGYTADVTISGCTFENLPMGVYFNPGAKGSIVGNTFDGMGHAAIGIDSTADVTITGNMVADTVISLEIFGNDEIKLDEVLTTNTLPEGSQVVGGKILVPQEKTVYNKNTGEEYEDIQAAVNAADEGDTILVGPGEYSVSELLTIDKPLVLRGTSPDLPVVNFGQSYKESILVKADNVTLEHLHLIKEFKGDDGSDQNCLLSIPRGGTWTAGYQVEYDDITLKGLVFEGGRTGAYITARNLTIEDCLFKDQHSKILYFNIVAGDTNVKGNTFLGDSGHAIRFEGFSDKETPHGGNITIENNVVEGKSNFLVYNGWRYDQGADPVNIRVIGNEIRSLKGDAVVIYNYFPNLHDVIVLDNDFSGVVEGSYGVRGPGQTFITATNNYWGHKSGPYNGLSNPNGEGCCVSNNVVFFPWYVDEGMSEVSPYEKGIINARDLSSYKSIQAAINAAQSGDTIFVSEGTYIGNLEIGKNLTLISTDGSDATSIKGNITIGDDNVTNVTIEGFTIDGKVEGPAGFDPQAIFEDNVFPEGSRIIGNKIMVPAAETVYNLRTGYEYECIQSAVSEAELGDTILVGSGTYEEDLVIAVENLTLVSVEKHAAIIETQGDFEPGLGYGGITILADGVTIDGFKIKQSVAQAIVHTHNADGVTIKNNSISGIEPSRGIDIGYASAGSNSVTVEGNEFADLYCGVYVNQGNNLVVESNVFNGMNGGAVVFDGTWGNTNNITVKDNEAKDAEYLLFFYDTIGSVVVEGNDLTNTELSNYGVYSSGLRKYFPTLQAAVGAASTGDTLLVAPGDYDEILGVQNKSLTIVGLDKENTKVKAISAYPGSSNDLVIKNLTVYGNNGSGQSYAGVYIANGNVTVENCKIAPSDDADKSKRGIETQYNNDAVIVIKGCDMSGYKSPYFNPTTGSLLLQGNDFNGSGPSIDGITNVTVTGNSNMSIGFFAGYGLLDRECEEVLKALDDDIREFVTGLHLNNANVVVKLSTNDSTDNNRWGGYYTELDEEGNLIITEQYLSK